MVILTVIPACQRTRAHKEAAAACCLWNCEFS